MTRNQLIAILIGFLIILGWNLLLQLRLEALERSAVTQYDLTLALESRGK